MIKTITRAIRFTFNLIGTRKKLKLAQIADKKGQIAERDAIVRSEVFTWVKTVVDITESTVSVFGTEHVPQDTAVVFVGNHQGLMDIPLILGYINKQTAFISKIEIKTIPIIAPWMKIMQCIFMDRKDRRQSVEAMAEAVATLKRGYSLVIFPEGTRSRGGPIAEFKAGSFKFAYRAGVPIVPITIDGTWHIWEEYKRVRGADLRLTIHPPFVTAGLSREEQAALPELVRRKIASALPASHLRQTGLADGNL